MMRVAYLQPVSNGQTFALDSRGQRIDSFGGPPDFVAIFYSRCGYQVVMAA